MTSSLDSSAISAFYLFTFKAATRAFFYYSTNNLYCFTASVSSTAATSSSYTPSSPYSSPYSAVLQKVRSIIKQEMYQTKPLKRSSVDA